MIAVAAMPFPPGHAGRDGAFPRRLPRRAGSTAVLLLGFAAQLGWALLCSLGLGLGRRPPPEGPEALIWLAVTVALAVATGILAWLAARDGPTRP